MRGSAVNINLLHLHTETANRPLGVTATALTGLMWAGSVAERSSVVRSQTRNMASAEPQTANRPSGVTATAVTGPVWNWNVI